VKKVALNTKRLSDLIDMAAKTSSKEFLHLIETCIRLLATEYRGAGGLRTTGRLVEVPPVGEAVIVGDIHGDLESLKHILEDSSFIEKANRDEDILLIFLGDYGDRGLYSAEVFYVVLKLKQLFPERVILMRGNHEGPDDLLAYPHDLPFLLNRKFGERGSEIYLKLRELFKNLYNAVLVDERYVLLHGGAPSQASNVGDIAYAHEKHPRERHLEEILWNDPWEGIKGTCASPRGAGRLFGEDVTDRLLKMLAVKALIRGHEPGEEGFKTNHKGRVLTIFSRRGPPYYNNYGAYLYLDLSRKVGKPEQLLQSLRRY